METLGNKLTEAQNITERDRLDLIDKRVEIQKKRLEIRKERMSMERFFLEKEKEQLELAEKQVEIQGKLIENNKAEFDIEELIKSRNIESERLLNDKIFSLLLSLIATTIDENKTILGSEPFFKPILVGEKREIVITKLLEIIKKI